MQTKEQIEQAFRAELQTLLDKYGAELEAKDHYQGYAECGEDVCMTVNIPGIWDKDGETVREWTEIDLGSHLWPTPNFVLGRLPCCVTSLLLHNIKHRPTA